MRQAFPPGLGARSRVLFEYLYDDNVLVAGAGVGWIGAVGLPKVELSCGPRPAG